MAKLMNSICVILRDRSQAQKSMYCMIPFIQHSGKGKTIRVEKSTGCQGFMLSGRIDCLGPQGTF